MKRLGKELGALLLVSIGAVLVLAIVALVPELLGAAELGDAWWRLCAFAGAIVLLLAAVLLLTNRRGSGHMEAWETRFPHVPFPYAVGLVGAVLLAAACLINFIAF